MSKKEKVDVSACGEDMLSEVFYKFQNEIQEKADIFAIWQNATFHEEFFFSDIDIENEKIAISFELYSKDKCKELVYHLNIAESLETGFQELKDSQHENESYEEDASFYLERARRVARYFRSIADRIDAETDKYEHE